MVLTHVRYRLLILRFKKYRLVVSDDPNLIKSIFQKRKNTVKQD